jgi:tryptophan synthase beta subunit
LLYEVLSFLLSLNHLLDLIRDGDLNRTGAHKTNNILGQILLARRVEKNKLIYIKF